MRITGFWRLGGLRRAAGVLAVTIAGSVSVLITPALAASGSVAHPAGLSITQPTGPVSDVPASGTPALVQTSTTGELIKQLVQCGGTMYAVGSFSEISWNGTVYQRNNIFSFSATAPYTMTSWNPNVNNQVESIQLSPNCSSAYIGGRFTTVGGTPANHIAEISTSTGAVNTAWGNNANNPVATLLLTPNGHLLVGGYFTKINGSTAHPFYASLNPATGQDDGFLNLHVSGSYHYCSGSTCSSPNSTSVHNQQLSNGGTLVLVEGIFTKVGGQARQQIFMLNLATSPATVSGWTSPEFDGSKGNLPGGYPYQCSLKEPFYVQTAAWSPDDSTVYLADYGKAPWNWNGKYPLIGLCDSTSAFPATRAPVTHEWINYTGCDSLFAAAADQFAVYVAGHPRWSQNPDGCEFAGKGAITDYGMQGLNPATGNDMVKSNGKAVYSMDQANADDMLLTTAGLWIASSDRFGLQVCNHVSGHAGICFLPYP